MTTPLRALSAREISSCEHARSPREACECRCGGQYHGVARVADDRAAFEGLPATDPHHLVTADERKRDARIARIAM